MQSDIITFICNRGKFTAGVVETGGKFPAVSLTLLGNLPPVAKFTTSVVKPLVHLDL
jgi:hypothetical protein